MSFELSVVLMVCLILLVVALVVVADSSYRSMERERRFFNEGYLSRSRELDRLARKIKETKKKSRGRS